MKRTVIIASAVFCLIGALWVGFSFGIYYQARVGCAFTANQVLRARYLLTRPKDLADGVEKTDAMAARWEARAENTTVLEAFDPHNIPSLLSLSGEKMLLQHNHEIKEQLLAATNQSR